MLSDNFRVPFFDNRQACIKPVPSEMNTPNFSAVYYSKLNLAVKLYRKYCNTLISASVMHASSFGTLTICEVNMNGWNYPPDMHPIHRIGLLQPPYEFD